MSACEELHKWANSQKIFRIPFDDSHIPRNGVYLVFERGETCHGANRIVRVGSDTGNNQLRSRLRQHFIHENKDRSIFRKNIGRAILNRDHDPFLPSWELDLTTLEMRNRHSEVDLNRQGEIEAAVTTYMQNNFSFVVVGVKDRTERLTLEARMIATLFDCEACQPSTNWLGKYSTKQRIRESGLWLVNLLQGETLSAHDLEQLDRIGQKRRF